jgi:tryptophan synthase alpha chain
MTAQARRSSPAVSHGAAAPAPTGAAAPTPPRGAPSTAGTSAAVGTGAAAGTGSAAGTPAGTADTPGARRIAASFARAAAAGRAALIPYVVAGYPDHATSLAAALAAADAGADLLEVGLPYSDPLADGATLQRATTAALRAGATLDGSVTLLREIAAARPGLPLVPMCYANQILGGGDGRAVATRLAQAGASGVIVADLTPDEGPRFEAVARDVGLAVVYLIAPTTTAARRAEVARRSGGFLYCVSLVGVTGARPSLPASVRGLVAAAGADSPVPVAVGFGVSRPAHVRMLVDAGADGVIVASALVDALGPDGRDVPALAHLVEELRAATAR